jgi:hypothetical protein
MGSPNLPRAGTTLTIEPSRWGHVPVTRDVEDEPFAGWLERGREE